MQIAVFNNAYGITKGSLGANLLAVTVAQLTELYPHVAQIENEMLIKILGLFPNFEIKINKQIYVAENVVIEIGCSNTFAIEGLLEYVEKHPKSVAEKQRIWLKNIDHKVTEGIYVTGTLAGWRSQLAIGAGSGATVATDILTLWNNGVDVQIHDSVQK